MRAPSPPTPTPVPPPTVDVGATPSEWLDFVSSLVSTLAWPVFLFIIVVIFRDELKKLVTAVRDRIPSMTSVKLPGGVEAVWTAQAVEKLNRDVDKGLPNDVTPTNKGTPSESDPDKSIGLAHILPSAGVINAFLAVELAVRDLLERLEIPVKTSPLIELRRVQLPLEIRRPLDELRRLRNAAAHGAGDISLESALTYIESARRIAGAFDSGEYDHSLVR